MQEIIIDEEFRFLLPTLDEETFRLLEESLLEHGCRDPLVLWNGILIDGYNRFRICTYHNIPFSTVDMEFDTREEVVIWIVTNQISRRNLTPIQLSYFRGLHYNADKDLHGDINRVSRSDSGVQNSENALNTARGQNGTLHTGRTAIRLSEQYNVSPRTIKRDAKLSDGLTAIGKISQETMRKILNGEERVSKSTLEALASATPEKVKSVARDIEEGTFASRTPRGSGNNVGDAAIGVPNVNPDSILPEIRQLNAIISNFAISFNSVIQEMKAGNQAPLREVLRSYIDELEELYSKLER